MTGNSTFSSTLHTLGFIEAISRFGEQNAGKIRGQSLEDYVGKITALFSPYISQTISEKQFSAVQIELKKILSEFNKSKERNIAL